MHTESGDGSMHRHGFDPQHCKKKNKNPNKQTKKRKTRKEKRKACIEKMERMECGTELEARVERQKC